MKRHPHPEVVNKQPRVLIVGYGHVGRQIGRYFTRGCYVDIDKVVHWVADDRPAPPQRFELGFICVPTPENFNGRCDASRVTTAFERWGEVADWWCVKSTVEVGFTERLGNRACFSPEYYGETRHHPLRESLPFVILGGPREVTSKFATGWSLVTHPDLKIIQTDSRTAELCKLMENSWLATKVSFCNEFYDLAQLAGVDWHELRELWLADPRINRSHTYVYPNNRGFGGKCLPKDTANLCAWAQMQGQPADLLEAVRAYNSKLRGE